MPSNSTPSIQLLRVGWTRVWRGEFELALQGLQGSADPAAVDLRARVLLLLGRTREAVGVCEAANVVGVQGVAYRLTGAPLEAVRRCDAALEATQPPHPQALIDAGLAHTALGDLDKARVLLADAIDLARQERRISATLALATCRLAADDLDGASQLASQSARAARRNRASHLEARALTLLARVLTGRHDYRAARKLHRLAGDLHRKHGHLAGVAASLGGTGLCAVGIGLTSEGVREFNHAIALCRQLEHRERESYWRAALDRGLVLLQRPEERVQALEQWLQLVRELHDHTAEAAILCDLGNTHLELRDPTRAAHWHRRALDVSVANGNDHAATIDRLNLGLTLAQLDQHEEASRYLVQGLASGSAPAALETRAREVLEGLKPERAPLRPPSAG